MLSGVLLQRGPEDLLHALPAAAVHDLTRPSESSRRSQARARVHSRFTVASEMSITCRGFFDGEAAEIAHLDDLRLPLVEGAEAREGFIDGRDIFVGFAVHLAGLRVTTGRPSLCRCLRARSDW